MQLGIIGLPQSGKTTLYKALTGAEIPAQMSAGQLEVHTAVVDVPDPRVDKLVEIYHPKKIVRAKVTYADIAGLDGSAGSSGISGALLNQLAQMDGYIHVVRHFQNDSVPHISGSIDPLRDIRVMDTEFILSDLRVASRAQSQPHTDEAACAYFAKPSAWVSYCNAGDGVHRAEVPRTATPPAQLATGEPLHPHGAPTAGGASSSRLVGPGATLAITTSGAAYEAVLEVPHPDPVVPPSRTTIRVTPRVGG